MAEPAGPSRAGRRPGWPWWVGEVVATHPETPRATTLVLAVPGWPGHRPGQHVDVRLTAADGYQAVRSYSLASPPEDGERLALTVERLDDGEVSPYLTGEVRAGDRLELRGPIGGYFTCRPACSIPRARTPNSSTGRNWTAWPRPPTGPRSSTP